MKERYNRQIILDEIGEEGQKKISNTSVLLVGFGGLGTGVAMFLARMGIGKLGLMDSDTIDISNLPRQILFYEEDVGRPKLDAGIEKLQKINKNTKIEKYETRLNEENAKEIISKYDIVVDCTDNFITRCIINRTCIDLNKKCVFGAVNEFGGTVMSFSKDTPCYECIMGKYEDIKDINTTSKPVGVLGSVVSLVSSIEATEVIKIILNIGNILNGRMIIIDGLEMSIIPVAFKKKQDCYCSRGIK